MGYYMRFFVADERGLSLERLEAGLKRLDPPWRIERDPGQPRSGLLHFGAELLGEIEINEPGESLFDAVRDAHIHALASYADDAATAQVHTALDGATAIVAVRVLWQGRPGEETLARLEPLWRWLFANREGLLHADADGYHTEEGRLLAEEAVAGRPPGADRSTEPSPFARQVRDQKARLARVRAGFTRAEVRATLGEPSRVLDVRALTPPRTEPQAWRDAIDRSDALWVYADPLRPLFRHCVALRIGMVVGVRVNLRVDPESWPKRKDDSGRSPVNDK